MNKISIISYFCPIQLKIKMKSFGALCLSLILVISISAQPEKAISNKDTYNWMFGASWILTDDDGESFCTVSRDFARRLHPINATYKH